jgi:hypothetical protein
MATRTLGTNATTTLTAVPFPAAGAATRQSDFAAVRALIKDDFPLLWPVGNAGTAAGQNATQMAQAAASHALLNNALTLEGLLFVPNRGVLKVLPGDWIGVDVFGWPILVSGRSIQSSTPSWTFSGNPS